METKLIKGDLTLQLIKELEPNNESMLFLRIYEDIKEL
jgi:hypothetical protein